MAGAEEARPGTVVLEATRSRTRPPPRFRVLLHDDDFTTMEFVVQLLESLFGQTPAGAVQIMLDVHQRGVGVAGTYSHEIAEEKAVEVIRRARAADFPFLATLEPAEE